VAFDDELERDVEFEDGKNAKVEQAVKEDIDQAKAREVPGNAS
jgi:hypothetical protein